MILDHSLHRRRLLVGASGGLAAALLPSLAFSASPLNARPPADVDPDRFLEALPGKRPLIRQTQRPFNYETPLSYFDDGITQNDAFFVRYHLSGVPTRINPDAWRLEVGGEGISSSQSFTLLDLKKQFEQVDIEAVCQCSGNRRGFSTPRVPGVQWGSGAMGSAVWRGVRLKDVLNKAGIRKETVEIVIDGADGPPLTDTPDFVKSIPLFKALDDNTLIATSMNGEDIPHLNGAPARLIIPGWTATYWMKHLTFVRATTRAFDGFWMRQAYRIPNGMFPLVQRFPTQETEANAPITEMVVNSLITAPNESQRLQLGQPFTVKGVAWDAGYGISGVDVSNDNGQTWQAAALGPDRGRFAFRAFSASFAAEKRGSYQLFARARNRVGQTQVEQLLFNAAGYHNNVIRPTTITII